MNLKELKYSLIDIIKQDISHCHKVYVWLILMIATFICTLLGLHGYMVYMFFSMFDYVDLEGTSNLYKGIGILITSGIGAICFKLFVFMYRISKDYRGELESLQKQKMVIITSKNLDTLSLAIESYITNRNELQ